MKKYQKILIVVAILLLAITIPSAIYVNDYYHADGSVSMCMQSTTNYDITVSDKLIVYSPLAADTGIIFYPGGKVEFESYTPILSKLADNGIFCALVKMPGNLAMFDINAANKIDKSKYPNIKHWYMAGHSLGGAMAANYISKNADIYEGLILLASYSANDLSNTDLNVISIYGSCDLVLNKDNYEKNKANLPTNYYEYVIEGGCHGFFGNYGHQAGDGDATITREAQEDITVDYIVSHIN